MSFRSFGSRALFVGALALGVSSLSVLAPSDAAASVSIAIGFDALVKDADAVAVMSPVEANSVWEDGRIYTYTKMKAEQGVAGSVGAGAEAWVRTMGGVVGKIGQMVDGEPVFVNGKSSMLFLRKFKSDAIYEVSARGQGQYPITFDEQLKVRKVIRSNAAGLILPPRAVAATNVEVTTPATPASQPGPVTDGTKYAEANVAKIRLAHEVIHDRTLDDASREIATAWRRLHPPAAK